MEQQITDSIILSHGYRIDKQFLVCLNDCFTKYDSDVKVLVEASNKHNKYRFSSISEFIDYSPKFTDVIEDLSIDAHFLIPKSYSYNQIKATFTNTSDFLPPSDRITFNFSDPNGYLILKNQIETLIKNYKLGYSWIARTPVLTIVSTATFWSICYYTNLHDIVFPKNVQTLIWFSWFLCLALAVFPPIRKMKRFVYPLNELEFGINCKKNLRGKNIRDIVHISVILAFVVGIAVNIASNVFLKI